MSLIVVFYPSDACTFKRKSNSSIKLCMIAITSVLKSVKEPKEVITSHRSGGVFDFDFQRRYKRNYQEHLTLIFTRTERSARLNA
ncbi:CLUMA_CG009505, isoform A [Clunio marinus]|uniref:CLUMA_CG009505, isoform A n=1 Tax=Clunio marinus TaxID=568069 RepID=A0A1J1I715_9DIPT|nr:CLUMA_CG009505, isoform A [Clunio marinus]